MGWAAQLLTGEIIREIDDIRWNDIDIHLIDKLWIEGFEGQPLSRTGLKNFLEFIQFKTAIAGTGRNINIESRCIGWTDGKSEYLLRFYEGEKRVIPEISERVHFHPLSRTI